MFTGERKNWILGWFFFAYYGRKVLEKWLEPKIEKLAKRKGGKSNYTCKIVALFNLSSLEDIDMKNKNKSA